MKILIVFTLLCQIAYMTSCDNNSDIAMRGEVVWSVPNQNMLTVSTQPTISNDRVFLIQDANLNAYELEDGEIIWKQQLCSQSSNCDYSRTIVQSGNQLFIDQGYSIKSFDISDGSILWNTQITSNSEEISGIGSPIMSQDDQYLYAGRKGYVLKIEKETGQVIQRYTLNHLVPQGLTQGTTEPIISPFEDRHLYIPTNYYDSLAAKPVSKGNVFSYDADTGEYQWGYHIENRYHVYTLNEKKDSTLIPSSVYDAEVTSEYVVLLSGGSVIALDRLTGQKVWETFFTGEIQDGFYVGLAIKDMGVYIASSGWHATKLDLDSGDILWRRDIEYSNISIPTIQNGRMYFNNSGGGGIWVLDIMDGSVIYHKNPPNFSFDDFDVYISSLAVGEGYMVDVGSKAAYCLKVP